jgi:SAM-dependent methyltransferase
MGSNDTQNIVRLNIGCGMNVLPGFINVDGFGDPDIKHDLNLYPWPFDDRSVDGIAAWHVMEHLEDWWKAFQECARILRPGGYLEVRVPDESSRTALAFRDHRHVFHRCSFNPLADTNCGTNSWAKEQRPVPFRMVGYHQVPFKEYEWMVRWCPRVLNFCAEHLRNFIWEQRFTFIRLEGEWKA